MTEPLPPARPPIAPGKPPVIPKTNQVSKPKDTKPANRAVHTLKPGAG